MKDEIRQGVNFLRHFLAKFGCLDSNQIELFAYKLTLILRARYINHWYEDSPLKGQGFRCLCVKKSENYIDTVLDQILKDTKLSISQLGLPDDFTLWIDPGEVSVRFGDQVGYTYTIAKLKNKSNKKDKQQQQQQQTTTTTSTSSSSINSNSSSLDRDNVPSDDESK
jgi:protein Tob/BTG